MSGTKLHMLQSLGLLQHLITDIASLLSALQQTPFTSLTLHIDRGNWQYGQDLIQLTAPLHQCSKLD
jgi:hypothetical protein